MVLLIGSLIASLAMMLDFDSAKLASEGDLKKISKLIRGIGNNYPDALPDLTNEFPINQYGSIITPEPVAMSIRMTRSVRVAIETSGAKLMHALY